MEWKCGNCGKTYDTFELISLKKCKMVESDIDPKKEHGYTSVCTCGYRFGIDRWRINNNINLNIDGKESEIMISTIFLEHNDKIFDDEIDKYYESAILWALKIDKENRDIQIIQQYDTKENAIGGHNKILDLIKNGKYKIEKEIILEHEEYRISFEEKNGVHQLE